MIGTAQATIQIKDLWSSKASSIEKSIERLDKKILKLDKTLGRTSESYKKYGRDIGSFQKKYKELAQLPKIRLSNIIDTTLQKPIAEVEKLKRKLKEPAGKTFLQEAQEEAKKLEKELNAVIAKKNAIKSDPALRNQIKQNENTRRQLAMEQGKGGSIGGLVGTAVGTVSGVAFVRSAINNATEYNSALYQLKRQLPDDEDIRPYETLISKYALKTGMATSEVAKMVAELNKTRKAGEGIEVLTDRIDLMNFAINQLEVDSFTAARSMEVLGKAFNMNTQEMKSFFAGANDIEDFYGTLVSGGDLLEIFSRMPLTLLQNTKLLNKEAGLVMATFSKANTTLDASAVGYNLGKILEGGTKAKGGGIIATAEREGKTLQQKLIELANQYKSFKTTTEQSNFLEAITGTNDLQAKDVARSVLIEYGKLDKVKIDNFLKIQKGFETGTVSAKEYRQNLGLLNEAERSFVRSQLDSKKGLESFNRTVGELAQRLEATLGRVSNSYNQISKQFGESVIAPILMQLADALEVVTPYIADFIKDYPVFIGLLAGTLAIASIKSLAGALFGLGTALTEIKLAMVAISKNPVFLAITAGTLAYEYIKKQDRKFTDNLTPKQRQEWESNENAVQKMGLNAKEVQNRREALRKKFANENALKQDFENAIKNPITQSQLPGTSLQSLIAPPMPIPYQPPRGEIVLNIQTQDGVKASATVNKQDNISLILPQATTTLRI